MVAVGTLTGGLECRRLPLAPHAVDHIRTRDRPDLIRLDRTQVVPGRGWERGPLGVEILSPVHAEVGQPSLDGVLDGRQIDPLAGADEADLRRVTPGPLGGCRDARPNLRDPGRDPGRDHGAARIRAISACRPVCPASRRCEKKRSSWQKVHKPGSVEGGLASRVFGGCPQIHVLVVCDRTERLERLDDLGADLEAARADRRAGEDFRRTDGRDRVLDDPGDQPSPPGVGDGDPGGTGHQQQDTVGRKDGDRLRRVNRVQTIGISAVLRSLDDVASVDLVDPQPRRVGVRAEVATQTRRERRDRGKGPRPEHRDLGRVPNETGPRCREPVRQIHDSRLAAQKVRDLEFVVLEGLPFDGFVSEDRVHSRVLGEWQSCSVDVRLGPFMYPSLVTTESPIVRAILRASEVMLGKPVETYYSPSAFDQGYLNHVGIATANFGAGEHQYAHTDYDMASVERTAESGAGLCVHDAGLSSLDHHAHAANCEGGGLGWLEDAALEADKCHSRIPRLRVFARFGDSF